MTIMHADDISVIKTGVNLEEVGKAMIFNIDKVI
jgi:hypothetical protein